MFNATDTTSMRRVARTAGVLYLVIIVAGLFAEMFARGTLVVSGDAAATAANIAESEILFRLGIISDLIMILSDVAIGLAFYVLLRSVNQSLALLAAFLRLAQAIVLGINLLNLFFALRLLSGAEYLTAFTPEQLQAQALTFINMHATGYRIGLVFFAFSLLVKGYLIFRSGYFPRVLGIALVIAAFAYLTDSFADVLMPNYADYEDLFTMIVFLPAFAAELALTLFLLIRGIGTPREARQMPSGTVPAAM